MTNVEILDGRRDASGGYKVDVSRGGHNGRVSSEWFSRPDDEKFLSLSDLYASVKGRAARSKTRTVESAAIRVEAHRDDPEKLTLALPDAKAQVAPTHWSFGQLASLVSAPAAYLRQLPAPLAGINLQYGLTNHRAEQVKTLETEDGRLELRAVTGPDYGRIYDHELVSAVQRIAGDGVGDTRWKVPGVLDWSTGVYSPMVDVTKDTTTLYASDRDVFLFGQRRVLLVWTRLILPNGRSIVLERQPGADEAGYAGLEDAVDYHWGQLLRAAGLATILNIGLEFGQDDDNEIAEAIRDGAQDTVGRAGDEIVRRQLTVPPTLTIQPGFPVRVMVTRDLILEPYES